MTWRCAVVTWGIIATLGCGEDEVPVPANRTSAVATDGAAGTGGTAHGSAMSTATAAEACGPVSSGVVDNHNGTVTWCGTPETGLVWQQSIAPGTYAWADAKIYCDGLELVGSGWRLPTDLELLKLVDTVAPLGNPWAPAITYGFLDTPAAPFWSSRSDVTPNFAWTVSFDFGAAKTSPTTDRYNVRCATMMLVASSGAHVDSTPPPVFPSTAGSQGGSAGSSSKPPVQPPPVSPPTAGSRGGAAGSSSKPPVQPPPVSPPTAGSRAGAAG
jgi:hypothetical protein